MTKFINKIDATTQSHNLAIQNQAASIKNLETKIGQLTNNKLERECASYSLEKSEATSK